MAAEIPARLVSTMRKERMDAGIRLRRVEDELCLTVLLQNGVIVIHGDRSVRVSVGCSPYAENDEVEAKGDGGEGNDRQQRPQEHVSQPVAQRWGRSGGHEPRLYAQAKTRRGATEPQTCPPPASDRSSD